MLAGSESPFKASRRCDNWSGPLLSANALKVYFHIVRFVLKKTRTIDDPKISFEKQIQVQLRFCFVEFTILAGFFFLCLKTSFYGQVFIKYILLR